MSSGFNRPCWAGPTFLQNFLPAVNNRVRGYALTPRADPLVSLAFGVRGYAQPPGGGLHPNLPPKSLGITGVWGGGDALTCHPSQPLPVGTLQHRQLRVVFVQTAQRLCLGLIAELTRPGPPFPNKRVVHLATTLVLQHVAS